MISGQIMNSAVCNLLNLDFLSKQAKENGKSSAGKTAFTLSLISLCLLIVPFGIIISIPLAIIGMSMGTRARKENKDDKKAKTAIILSMITLGLIIAVALLVAILFSASGFAAV